MTFRHIDIRWIVRLGLAASLMALLAQPALSARRESLSARGVMPESGTERLEWGRDPFVPLISGVAAPGMRLTAIFYNRKRPSAIVNDKIVYKGSVVGGQKVIDIGKSHVILQNEAGRIRLEIAEVPEFLNDGE